MRAPLSRQGFTLIELLTVIAIMAILSSMLFPSFSRAREMARRTSCASNMRQLGLGFRQYVDDYDGRFPGAGQYQKWGDGGHWVAGVDNQALAKFDLVDNYVHEPGRKANIQGGALYPYVKSEQIYVCPSSKDGQDKGLDYSMNCALAGGLGDAVQSASEVILLVDEDRPSDGFFYANADSTTSFGSTDHMTQIHNGGGNLLFCDGHTKFFPYRVFPIGDNKVEPQAAMFKTRTSGFPRFFDSDNFSAGGGAFGSCTVSPTPTPGPITTP